MNSASRLSALLVACTGFLLAACSPKVSQSSASLGAVAGKVHSMRSMPGFFPLY